MNLVQARIQGRKTQIYWLVRVVLPLCLYFYLAYIIYHYSSTSVYKLDLGFTAGRIFKYFTDFSNQMLINFTKFLNQILKHFTTLRLKTVQSAANYNILKYFTKTASPANNQIEVGLICCFIVSRISIKILRKIFTDSAVKRNKYLKLKAR